MYRAAIFRQEMQSIKLIMIRAAKWACVVFLLVATVCHAELEAEAYSIARVEAFNTWVKTRNIPVNKLEVRPVPGMRFGAFATEDIPVCLITHIPHSCSTTLTQFRIKPCIWLLALMMHSLVSILCMLTLHSVLYSVL